MQQTLLRTNRRIFARQLGLERLETRTVPALADLDMTFGTEGIVEIDFGFGSTDLGRGMAVQADGKYVVVGSSNQDFAAVRYNPDGSLDTSFGGDGKVTVDIAVGANDIAEAVAIQPDGKILIVGATFTPADGNVAAVRLNPDGSIDSNYGASGVVNLDLSGVSMLDRASDVVIQPDGKAVISGEVQQPATGRDFLAARLNTDGSLDFTFGTGGMTAIDFATKYDAAEALTLDGPDIILVGGATPGADSDFGVARLDSSGSLVIPFGAGGKLAFDISAGSSDRAAAVALIGTDIIVAGDDGADFAVARFTFGGAVIPAFGIGGRQTVDFAGSSDRLSEVLIDGTDIVITGTMNTGLDTNFAAARLSTGGTLIPGFGIGGKQVIDLTGTGAIDMASGAALSGTDIVISGGAGRTGPGDIGLVRIDSAGNLVPAFDGDGKVLTDVRGESLDAGNAMAVQPDGKVVIVGTARNNFDTDFAIARYNPDGTLDGTFGAGGLRLIDISGGSTDQALGLAVQPDGKIVVAGDDGKDFVVVRLNPDGSNDVTFGGGTVTIDFAGKADRANDVALQGSDIIVVGQANNGVDDDFAFARLLGANGTLDPGFAGTGKFTLGGVGSTESINAVVVQPSDNKFVVAGTDGDDFIFGRFDASGTLDLGFGTAGKTVLDVSGSGNVDEPMAMALRPDGSIVAAGRAFNGFDDDFAMVRLNANGQPDLGFGTGGKVVLDINAAGKFDTAFGVATHPDGNTVVVGTNSEDIVVVRLDNSGALDADFSGGVKLFDIAGAGNTDLATGVAIPAPYGRIVIGGGAGQFSGNGTIENAVLLRVQGLPGPTGPVGQNTTDQHAVGPGSAMPGSATAFPVNVYDKAGTELPGFNPFPDFTGGVRTALADVNGDDVPDLIAGTGPGVATSVMVINGLDQTSVLFSVSPFEATFTGGVYVAAGDMNADGKADIAITPDQGGGPRVRVFEGGTFTQLNDFFGIEDPNFRGGARAAFGDLNADGRSDLLVVAGFGGGPRIAGFDGNDVAAGAATPIKLFGDFFVFEPTLRNGVFIASGDLDGDEFADVIAGGGPGGGPRVFGLSGQALVDSFGADQLQVANFFAGDPANRGGIRLVVKDLDSDTQADLVTGDGSDAGSRVTRYLGANIQPNNLPTDSGGVEAFPGFLNGVFIG